MPNRTESIKLFLEKFAQADLADLYTPAMECQVNVAQDNGTRITGEFMGKAWHGWTDGVETWKPFRIPWNAATHPEYEDSKMNYDLSRHAEGIGMTGWDWQKRLSRWVAFDFDAIAGHKNAHQKKVTEVDLEEVKRLACEIPWVTVRRSASGKGLHLYVFFNPCVLTQNHNEHAALARAVLGQMSAQAKYDFDSKVDICGGNMWVWHRKSKGTNGFELIKRGGFLSEIPPTWRDHVKVITGHRKKNIPKFIRMDEETPESEFEKMFLELTGQNSRVPLDDEHKRLINWLQENGKQAWWDTDHHMLVTHTFDLQQAHEALRFMGIFETLAKGSESGHDHNCFAFPLRNGGWSIRRYSMGASEAPSWDQDGRGWTRCFYNVPPDLTTAARSKGGIESPSGGFVFSEAEQAQAAATLIGAAVPSLPSGLRAQRATLKPHKDGRVVFEIEGDKAAVAAEHMGGWLHDKGKWKRLFNVSFRDKTNEAEITGYDEMIRHILTSSEEEYGWAIRDLNGKWTFQPMKHVATALESMGVGQKDLKVILGNAIMKSWHLVNKPFQSEYPGDREWNLHAAQLRFTPSQKDTLHHPSWNKILEHCGKNLNPAVESNAWCKANGVLSGAEYLKIWIASLFKEPQQPLPYLFFYGNEDCGKSIFHESLSLLMTRGYARADAALVNQQGFNDELKSAILCVVEEINLQKHKDANNRIKDWVTATHLPIHPKGKTPYHIPNTTHWVQVANKAEFCPVLPGDTRITMIWVDDLDPGEMIPKREIMLRLEAEGPDFLASVLRLEIPPSNSRLNIPMLATAAKMEVAQGNETPLQTFLREVCHYAPGEMIPLADLYDRFTKHNPDPSELAYWTKHRVSREMPHTFPRGRDPKSGTHCIGNISFEPPEEGKTKIKLVAYTPPGQNYTVLKPENNNGSSNNNQGNSR